MENKKPQTSIDQAVLDEAALAEAKAKRNKKIFIISAVAVAAVAIIIGAICTMRYFGNQKADELIAKADIEANDSLRFELYKQAADAGSYKSNERAQLMVAIKYYQDSLYKEALEYLEKPSINSDVINPGVYALKGDCYVNLNQLDEALNCYEKAISSSDNNPAIVPFILVKEANVYREQKNFAKEYDAYVKVRTDFPDFMSDIDKYVERARIAAGK
jgi:tetratricopeptide (TPR) repeat protein